MDVRELADQAATTGFKQNIGLEGKSRLDELPIHEKSAWKTRRRNQRQVAAEDNRQNVCGHEAKPVPP